MINPSLYNLSKQEQDIWNDGKGRALLCSILIRDELTPGALDQMMEQAYPGHKGAHPEFGEEIWGIAKRLQDE